MPHAGQRLVREQARRFNYLRCGRRWRKSTLCLTINVEGALREEQRIWGAPTFKQLRIAWDELRRAAAGVVTFNESRMEAIFPGGGKIQFVSLDDPDNARGYTADGITIDEAPFCAERAWTQVLRPMIMDTGGDVWFAFTPNGQDWVFNEVNAAEEREDALVVHAPTLGAEIRDGELVRMPHPLENPDIDFAELQQMFQTMPEAAFRQEILAEFLADGGAAFRNVEGCLAGELLECPPGGRGAYEYVMGVDLAKKDDYTVVVVADANTKQVVYFDRWNVASWPMTKGRIVGLAKQWNDATIWMDATGVGDPIYDDLHRTGMRVQPYVFTQQSREALLENAILMVEQRQVTYPRIEVLLTEMKSMGYRKTPSGATKMMVPENYHDDCIMAFALCCWPLARAGGSLARLMRDQLDVPYKLRGEPDSGRGYDGFGGLGLLRKDF